MRKRVVVIGAGLSGSLLCNELAADTDVTLLEIGERDRISYPAIRYDRRPLAQVPTFCFGGGGTTNLWHNGLIPIDPADVTGQEFREVLAESRPFMDAAAQRLHFTGPFQDTYRDAVAEARGIAENVGLIADGVDSLIYPKHFRPLTIDGRVNTVYTVDTIHFSVSSGRVDAVEYRTGSQTHTVRPTAVVVAGGAMGTPKILRDVIAATGATFERLGAGFIDHPLGFVGKVRFRRDAAQAVERFGMLDRGDYIARSAVRLKSACGRYTCCAFLRPALTIHNSLETYKYKSRLGASAGLTRVRNALSWRLLHPDIVAEVVSHLTGVNIPSRTYNILFVAEQRRGNNRVYYEGDALCIDWSISDEEIEIYRSMLRRLRALLQDVAEEVNLETELTADWLWSGAHHSCTTPLGNTVHDLIDRRLKLKFCENVFVCDGSVIQEHSYANTGLTIGQLALRLANEVRAHL